MPDNFVKLYRSILTSSVWLEALPTKVVWITMLAYADADGNVWASMGGLAHLAGVSPKQCREALKVLLAPDPDSRTELHQGRRIEKINGGWAVLNHQLYRDYRTAKQVQTAKRQARFRHRRALPVTPVTAEVEVEVFSKEKTARTALPTEAPAKSGHISSTMDSLAKTIGIRR